MKLRHKNLITGLLIIAFVFPGAFFSAWALFAAISVFLIEVGIHNKIIFSEDIFNECE